jgi:hypothetical protein
MKHTNINRNAKEFITPAAFSTPIVSPHNEIYQQRQLRKLQEQQKMRIDRHLVVCDCI